MLGGNRKSKEASDAKGSLGDHSTNGTFYNKGPIFDVYRINVLCLTMDIQWSKVQAGPVPIVIARQL